VTLVGHKLHDAIQQTAVEGQDELEAALRLLEEIDLEGKVVSADAGLLHASLAQKVVAKKGAISALSRATNQN
jgi:predicted transposase YbfD/YdcC